MIETPRVEAVPEQHAAVIHLTIERERMPEVMGPAIEELMRVLSEQGIPPTGPVFAHHLRMDPEMFDFEVGLPVARPVAARGRVRPGRLPAARVARTVYHGAYEGLGGAWEEFQAWMESAGHRWAPDPWERYVTGPESGGDPSTWRTELVRPLLGP